MAAEKARPEVFDLGTRDLNFFPFFTSRIASSLLLPTPQIYFLLNIWGLTHILRHPC
jgi:hypothetical protein